MPAHREVDCRYKAVPLETDRDGILPESLRETLQSTHRAALATNTRPPRVLYTVPTGQNPTGVMHGAPVLMVPERWYTAQLWLHQSSGHSYLLAGCQPGTHLDCCPQVLDLSA